jgi:hypothetical protein
MRETTRTEGAADQAREKAQEVGAQARDRVREQVDQRSTQAGEQAGGAAAALRQASDRLRQEGNEPAAKGIEKVAERVDSAGGWLRDSDGDAILRDVEDFGRRNPLAVVAGGLVLGFAASRLLKASSRSRYEASANGAPRQAPQPPPPVTPASPAPPAVADAPHVDLATSLRR